MPGRSILEGVRVTTAIARRLGFYLALAIALGACAKSGSGSTTVAVSGTPVLVKASNVEARIALSADHSSAGRELGVAVDFAVGPGWHIYGEPLPAGEGLTPTSIKFEGEMVAGQKVDLPKPTPLRFAALNETYPVYQGNFRGTGKIELAQQLKPGDYSIPGILNFQECNDAICKMPQSVHFQLPIKID
jgi:DsbC/DsbD-like thiol-disulfide interchange protein